MAVIVSFRHRLSPLTFSPLLEYLISLWELLVCGPPSWLQGWRRLQRADLLSCARGLWQGTVSQVVSKVSFMYMEEKICVVISCPLLLYTDDNIPCIICIFLSLSLLEIFPYQCTENYSLSIVFYGRRVFCFQTLMLGKIEGKRRMGWQRMRWLDSITNLRGMNLNKL